MTWELFYKQEKEKPYFKTLAIKVNQMRKDGLVFPKEEDVFSCFKYSALDQTKVVILGQDPYHNINQAHGLSFSVLTKDFPPSLQNIFKELVDDMAVTYPKTGNLTKWAKQGVLLLNTVLTVNAHNANSHKGFGWETFTEHAIKLLNEQQRPIVFVLWGSSAKKYKSLLNNPYHLVLESVHPSPLSVYRGFFGSKPFSKTNQFLVKHQVKPIDWDLNT